MVILRNIRKSGDYFEVIDPNNHGAVQASVMSILSRIDSLGGRIAWIKGDTATSAMVIACDLKLYYEVIGVYNKEKDVYIIVASKIEDYREGDLYSLIGIQVK